jgi:2'-5' RNA ligase
VLHVAVGEGREPLARLAGEVSERLRPLGVPPDDRPFTAHLTLARVRDGAEAGVVRDLQAFVPSEPFAAGGPLRVEGVVLYESRLSPRGPTYSARARFALGPA